MLRNGQRCFFVAGGDNKAESRAVAIKASLRYLHNARFIPVLHARSKVRWWPLHGSIDVLDCVQCWILDDVSPCLFQRNCQSDIWCFQTWLFGLAWATGRNVPRQQINDRQKVQKKAMKQRTVVVATVRVAYMCIYICKSDSAAAMVKSLCPQLFAVQRHQGYMSAKHHSHACEWQAISTKIEVVLLPQTKAACWGGGRATDNCSRIPMCMQGHANQTPQLQW